MINLEKYSKINISVMIPVYNGGETLAGCLDSVIRQTINNYEIIIVDNNSTDNTKNIIESYMARDKRIVYIYEPKKGRGSARNTGVKNCTGDIIIMTDSDCTVPDNWIEELTRPIIEESEDAVMGFEFNLSNEYWSNNTQKADEEFYLSICNGVYINFIDTKNFAIKKEVFGVNIFNPNMQSSEDFCFYLSIKDKIKIRFLPNIKVGHLHKNTIMGVILKNFDRGYWVSVINTINSGSMLKSSDRKKFFKKCSIGKIIHFLISVKNLEQRNILGWNIIKLR